MKSALSLSFVLVSLATLAGCSVTVGGRGPLFAETQAEPAPVHEVPATVLPAAPPQVLAVDTFKGIPMPQQVVLVDQKINCGQFEVKLHNGDIEFLQVYIGGQMARVADASQPGMVATPEMLPELFLPPGADAHFCLNPGADDVKLVLRHFSNRMGQAVESSKADATYVIDGVSQTPDGMSVSYNGFSFEVS
jgi:hypothetical protein